MLACSTWFASALILASSVADATTPVQFDQNALAAPLRVEARLKEGVTYEDKLLSQSLLKGGLKRGPLHKQRDLGPVVKEFCASAVRYPTAQALMLCAEAHAYFDKSMVSRLSGTQQKDYLARSLKYLSGLLASAETATKYTAVTDEELRKIQAAINAWRNS
jgi:hypothetical protein